MKRWGAGMKKSAARKQAGGRQPAKPETKPCSMDELRALFE